MKTLKHLEKSRSFWSILIISLLFFFLRLPSISEPFWYGDEGIYEVIGQAVHQGRLLYVDIWDNKPPLLYSIFAFFNGNQESVRTLSLIFGILSTIVFFSLSRNLLKKSSSSLIITVLFTLLFATPFLEGNIANAENFILLPILGAGLLLYRLQNHPSTINRQPLILAGLFLGIAFLCKIVAVFDLAAFLLFFWFIHLPPKIAWPFLKTRSHESGIKNQELWNALIPNSLFIILGFLIPLTITLLYFLSQGALKDFINAVFFGNINYVGLENTFLNIPQGFLIVKILLLLTALALIFYKRHSFSKPVLFILLWLTWSLFNAFFSQRPYTHYLLVLLPSFCLFIGLLLEATTKKASLLLLTGIVIILAIVKSNFWIGTPTHTIQYYQNMVLFITGQRDVQSYRSFFDPRTPRDYELASFINNHTTVSDDVFIWGDSAQIYALSHKLPINKYTVAYHITQNNALEETQRQLHEVKPKYIITLSETSPLPFSVPFYTMRFSNSGATIYERNF